MNFTELSVENKFLRKSLNYSKNKSYVLKTKTKSNSFSVRNSSLLLQLFCLSNYFRLFQPSCNKTPYSLLPKLLIIQSVLRIQQIQFTLSIFKSWSIKTNCVNNVLFIVFLNKVTSSLLQGKWFWLVLVSF